MARYKQYEGLSNDLLHECLNGMCKALDECDPSNSLCGIKSGIEYGIYPSSALTAPQSYLGAQLRYQLKYGIGVGEQPLWRLRDGMTVFSEKVAAYDEPWMKSERWGII